MQNPFYAPYANENNCCGDAGDCTGPCPADGWNNPVQSGFNPTFTGYPTQSCNTPGSGNPGFQGWNAPTYAGWNNPGFTGFNPGFTGFNPNATGYAPGYQGWNAPTYAGWNNPGFTGFNPGFTGFSQGFTGENTPGFNATGTPQPTGYGFNDFANVPASNPGTGSGTPGTTPATNSGHPGMNWTGGYATNAA